MGNITFNIGAAVDFKSSDDVCLATCEVVKPWLLGNHKGCEDVLPGSTKVSKHAGNKLCCTTKTCPTITTTSTPAAPGLTGKDFTCEDGQGPAFASYKQTGDNSFEACSALCEEDTECKSFDFTEATSTHPELLSLTPTLQKKDSCRLYKVAKLRSEDRSTSSRQFCKRTVSAEEEQDVEVQYLTGSSADGCMHPCGAGSLTVGDVEFSIGAGGGVDYQASPDMCLGNCATVKAGMLHTASCSAVLPGSEKVSKAGNTKLCCVSEACLSTTTTAVEPELSLDEKFSCQAGQGQAFKSYDMTGANSFEGCAALCEENKSCLAFDYTLDESNHPELLSFSPTLAKSDACRLYEANKPRLGDSGWSQRQYCEKKAPVDKSVEKPTKDVFWPDIQDIQANQSSLADITALASSGCRHACGETTLTIDGLDFEIGSGEGITYAASPDTCLGTCIVAKPGVFSNPSCSSVLPGSAKVSKSKKFKLCCISEMCPSTTTSTTTKKPEERFACEPGQGEASKSYYETAANSFESCAAVCGVEDECLGFDFTEKKSQHPELFSKNPTLAKDDSCRIYQNNKPRLGDAGWENRVYCQMNGREAVPEAAPAEPARRKHRKRVKIDVIVDDPEAGVIRPTLKKA